MRALTPRGIGCLSAMVALAVAGALTGAEELVLFAAALTVLLVGGWIQVTTHARQDDGAWRIDSAVSVHDVEVGARARMQLAVRSTFRGRRATVWVEDPEGCWELHRGPGRDRGSSIDTADRRIGSPSAVDRAIRLHVKGPEPVVLAGWIPTAERGIATLRGPRLWCVDPFGLFARQRGRAPSHDVFVHPSPRAPARRPELLGRAPSSPEASASLSRTTAPDQSVEDLAGIRPYVPGDRLRLLHWPAMARTGELMVRHFDDVLLPLTVIVVDTRSWLIGDDTVERLLGSAAGLGLELLGQGSSVVVLTLSGDRVDAKADPAGRLQLLRGLAVARTDGKAHEISLNSDNGARDWLGASIVLTSPGGARSLPESLRRTAAVSIE